MKHGIKGTVCKNVVEGSAIPNIPGDWRPPFDEFAVSAHETVEDDAFMSRWTRAFPQWPRSEPAPVISTRAKSQSPNIPVNSFRSAAGDPEARAPIRFRTKHAEARKSIPPCHPINIAL